MRYTQSTGHSVCYGNHSFLSRRCFRRFFARVVRHPRLNIVVPLLIAVILSCKLLSYVVHPSQVVSKLTQSQFISKVELLADPDVVEPRLSLVQIWMRSTEDAGNVLKKRVLLETLALQNRLLHGVNVEKTVSSPFQLWAHSLKNLQRDPAPVQTINSQIMSLPRYSLFGTWKINGIVSSAAGVTISILIRSTDYPQLREVLNQNVAQLNGMANITNFHIFAQPHIMDSINTESLQLFLVKLGSRYKAVIFLLYSALLLHLVVSMKRLRKTVKSVLGISLAMVSQIFFTLASAATVTKFCFKSSNDCIPVRALSCAVIFFGLNEQIRLLEDTGGSIFEPKPAIDHQKRNTPAQFYDYRDVEMGKDFVSCAADCYLESTKSLIVLSLVIALLIPFSRRVTFFLLLCFWFGHFLQCTFFTAALSLDRRRLEESDLTSIDSNLLLDDKILPEKGARPRLEEYADNLRFMCRNVYSVLLTIAYLVLFNIKFSVARSSTSLLSKLFQRGIRHVFKFGKPVPHVIFDQRFIAEGAFKLANGATNHGSLLANLIVRDPFLVLKCHAGQNTTQLENQLPSVFDASSFTSSYKLDFYYVFEFVLFVILLLSCTMLVLQKLTEKLDHINNFNFLRESGLENEVDAADVKKNKDGKKPYLQNLKDFSGTNDAKMKITDHFHAKELYKGGHSLDIVGVATSKSPFVVSFGLDYKVFVWSPLLKPIPNPTSIPLPRKFWPLSKVVLSNDGYYIAFFGRNGSITTWSRRQMKFVWELKLKKEFQSNDSPVTAPPLEAFFRKRTVPAVDKRLSTAAVLRPGLSRRSSMSSLEYTTRLTESGLDAAYEKVVFTTSDSNEKSELVFVTLSGFVYNIQTNGELQVEKLTASAHPLNSCKLLSSPRVNDRLISCDEMGDLYVSTVVNNRWRQRKLLINYNRMLIPPSKFCEIKGNKLESPTSLKNQTVSKAGYTIELVSFVGQILRVIGKEAELIDAMTGTVIRTFTIGLFKAGSLRVFHDNPTHCRFCGSASVASFSIAYDSFENEHRVTLHTFKLESRTKTSICMRVERDPREIRCLGMESTFETVHYFYDAEEWCVTDNNILIGIRRVPQDIPARVGTTSISTIVTEDDETGTLMKRKLSKPAVEARSTNASDFRIHNIWEGWTMSATGKISLHKIPIGVNGLIVNRLGPVARYGAKAMIVGFANIMNMFYVGHEELIFNPEKEDANKEELSLRFVNRRRDRLSSKKSPLNYNIL